MYIYIIYSDKHSRGQGDTHATNQLIPCALMKLLVHEQNESIVTSPPPHWDVCVCVQEAQLLQLSLLYWKVFTCTFCAFFLPLDFGNYYYECCCEHLCNFRVIWGSSCCKHLSILGSWGSSCFLLTVTKSPREKMINCINGHIDQIGNWEANVGFCICQSDARWLIGTCVGLAFLLLCIQSQQ